MYNVHYEHVSFGVYDALHEALTRQAELISKGIEAVVVYVQEPTASDVPNPEKILHSNPKDTTDVEDGIVTSENRFLLQRETYNSASASAKDENLAIERDSSPRGRVQTFLFSFLGRGRDKNYFLDKDFNLK